MSVYDRLWNHDLDVRMSLTFLNKWPSEFKSMDKSRICWLRCTHSSGKKVAPRHASDLHWYISGIAFDRSFMASCESLSYSCILQSYPNQICCNIWALFGHKLPRHLNLLSDLSGPYQQNLPKRWILRQELESNQIAAFSSCFAWFDSWVSNFCFAVRNITDCVQNCTYFFVLIPDILRVIQKEEPNKCALPQLE